MERDHCYCCGKPVGTAKEKKNRSKLSNTKLQGVLQVLSLLVAEVSSEVDLEKLKDGFGCRSCIDKLKHYAGKHHELKSNLCSAIPVLPKVPQPQQPTAQIDSPQPPTAAGAVHQEPSPAIHGFKAGSPAMTVCLI